MPVEWLRHCDVFSDLPPSYLDWVAFDDDEIVGRVMQYQHGREQCQWLRSIRGGRRPRPSSTVVIEFKDFEMALACYHSPE